MRQLLVATVAAVLFVAGAVQADEKVTFKAEKTAAPKELSDAVRSLLDEGALQVQDGNQTIATIWFRKSIPSNATPEQVKSGLTYREIPETTVVGAVQFPQVWSDYRKQKIAAGAYTLRIAFQPQNGDHMGTAPYNEFFLLSPAAKDTKAETMEPKELHELSASAPGGSHPGIMLLYPNSKPDDQPKIVGKPNSTWVLNVKRAVEVKGVNASLGFGLTVMGHTTQE